MRGLRALGPLLLTLTACSANVSSPGESDADVVTPAIAVVTFERITTTSDTRDVVRGAATARFVQARAGGAAQVDDRALKLVGAAFEAPPSVGCSLRNSPLLDESDTAAAGSALELAYVGALQVVQAVPPSGGGSARAFPLAPRQVPDPVGLVGGVLYYAPAPELSSQLVPGVRYTVRAAGSPGVPSFELSGTSPLEVSDVRVAGQTSGARAVISAQVAQTELAWSTPDSGAGDVFFVDVSVQRGIGANGGTLRCAADAAGAVIPGSAFATLAQEGDGSLAIHRVHRERVRANAAPSAAGAAGRNPLDSSELRFDFSRVVAFSRH